MSDTSAPQPAANDAVQPIDPWLLDILRCPLTRSRLELQGDVLVAAECGLRYPIREGIPVMLIEEAELPPGVESLDALKTKLRIESDA